MKEDEEHVAQDLIELVVAHEKELQQPHIEEVPNNEASRRSQRVRKLAISKHYEAYVSEEIQMEGDPTLFEEAVGV
jgi:hypothetical protein